MKNRRNRLVKMATYSAPGALAAVSLLVLISIGTPLSNHSYGQGQLGSTMTPQIQGKILTHLKVTGSSYNHEFIDGSNITNAYVNMTATYVPLGQSLGDNITIATPFGYSQVNVSGNHLTLQLSVVTSNNSTSVTNSTLMGISSPDVLFSPSISVAYWLGMYSKSPSGHWAVLSVARLGIYTLSIYSIPDIVATIGSVVVIQSGKVALEIPETSVLLGAIITILAADYAYMYGMAEMNQQPSIYMELGGSIGTQWYNFYQVGVYGEEGYYTGVYNVNGAWYNQIATSASGSNYLTTLMSHYGVWNPNAEPPWS